MRRASSRSQWAPERPLCCVKLNGSRGNWAVRALKRGRLSCMRNPPELRQVMGLHRAPHANQESREWHV